MSDWIVVNVTTSEIVPVRAESRPEAIREGAEMVGGNPANPDWRATRLTEEQATELGLDGNGS